MHDSKNAISVQNLSTTLAGTFSQIRSKDEEVEQNENTSDSPNGGTSKQTKVDDEEEEFQGFDDDSANDSTQKITQYDETNIDSSWLSTYTDAFWTTMIREWPTIDSHRMNKYLLLIRLVLRELFTICTHAATSSETKSINPKDSTKPTQKPTTKKSKTTNTTSPKEQDQEQQQQQTNPTKTQLTNLLLSQTTLLTKYPLNPHDFKIPNGLKLHVLDIYVDELERVLTEHSHSDKSDEVEKEKQKEGEKELIEIFEHPLKEMSLKGRDKTIRNKAKEEVKGYQERITEMVFS